MSFGIETGEYESEECYHWIENNFGMKYWDCERMYSTTRDASELYDNHGDHGKG